MSNKITIQRLDDDITDHLRKKGITKEANRFLRAAFILDQAGALDHLLLMYENGIHEKTSLLDMIEKSVNIGRLIKGEPVSEKPLKQEINIPDPKEDEDKDPAPSFFGA